MEYGIKSLLSQFDVTMKLIQLYSLRSVSSVSLERDEYLRRVTPKKREMFRIEQAQQSLPEHFMESPAKTPTAVQGEDVPTFDLGCSQLSDLAASQSSEYDLPFEEVG